MLVHQLAENSSNADKEKDASHSVAGAIQIIGMFASVFMMNH